jgi:glucose/arabinose dehydrogenase
VLLLLAGFASGARAQVPPAGFVVENPYPSLTFNQPVQIVFMPDGRKLVVEKGGVVWLITTSGLRQGTPFVNLSKRALSNGDRGLIGVALDPDFTNNGWVYFLYVVDPDSNQVDNDVDAYSRLERYRLNTVSQNQIDLTTRQVLIGVDWPSGIPTPSHQIAHTIGTLRFGTDGSLLLSSGDGAHYDSADAGGLDSTAFLPGRADPAEDIGAFRSQSINSMCGKILRVDKETGHGLPSNPYWNGDPTAARSRVWAYGLRNPFRFCVRPGSGSSLPGDGQPGWLVVGDVGWATWEELDVLKQGGMNLGWPCIEGPSATSYTSAPQPPGISCSSYGSEVDPVSPTGPQRWWNHANGSFSNPPGAAGNSIVGGIWYSGTSYPSAYRDRLFFADYVKSWIRVAQLDAAGNISGVQNFIDSGAGNPVDLEIDPATGDVWYVSISTGTIRRIRAVSSNHDPVAAANVGPLYGLAPLAVSFDGTASSDPDGGPLAYKWRFGDGDSAATAFASHTYAINGTYTAQLEVRDGTGGVDRRDFTLIVGQVPPAGGIVQPADLDFARPGDLLTLEAALVDTTAGPVSYFWDVDVVVPGSSVRPILTTFGRVSSITFEGAAPDSIYYDRIRLTFTQGPFTIRDTVRVYPRADARAGSSVAVPQLPREARGFTVEHWVGSSGLEPVPATDLQVLEGSVVLASGHLGTIAPGDSARASLLLTGLPAGDHVLRVVVDPAHALPETDETNNEASFVVHVRGPGEPFASWQADSADGNGPYATGSSSSPWRDVASGYDGLLPATSAPKWLGDGAPADPERLEFSGANNPVTLAAANVVLELSAPGPVSAELWFETGDDVVRAQTVLEWYAADTAPWPGLALGVESGSVRLWGSPWRAAAPVEPHRWYHLVMEQAADSTRLYVDGREAYADPAPLPGAQHSALLLGASGRGGSPADRFEGAIGAVRLYDEALGAASVRTAFLADSARFANAAPEAVAEALVLAADSATGSGPPAVPGVSSPWRDLAGGGDDADLIGFSTASDTSGWAGSPASGSPWRLELDGVDEVVRVAPGAIAALQSPGSASVAMWFRAPSVLAREQGLIEWNAGDPARSGVALELLSGRLRLWTGAGWTDVGGASAGVWHHVVVSKTSTVASVWLDGLPLWRGFSPALGPQLSALVIGALLPVATDPPIAWLRGAVARVEVTRGAFSDADVAARYAAQSAPFVHDLSAAQATPSCLGGTRTSVQVPVRLARVGTNGVLGYSVTLQWSPELQLAAAPVEGEFLSGTAPTFFQVTNGADRTVTVDCVRLGQGCAAPAAGDLFRLSFSAAVGAGTGRVRVLSATLRDCTNQPQDVDLGEPLAIPVDGSGPAAVSSLTSTAVDVPGGATRAMRLSFVAPAEAESVTVYRAPFGGYPEYDDVAGTGTPPAPTSDPPPAPWQRTQVHDTGHTDFVSTRDAWTYVAYAWDACGNRSVASVLTSPSVNYVLGDTRGGTGTCAGSGVVDDADVAPLLAHYGAHPANGDSLACLDYGPTVDGRLDARPATDDVLDFEDLMVMALDHSASAPDGPINGADQLSLLFSAPAAVGDTFAVTVHFEGSGQAHGVSATMSWNPARVAFVSARPGALLSAQGLPSVVVSLTGTKLDAALLGHGAGVTGDGDLAVMVFRRLTLSQTMVEVTSVHGRTAANADYAIAIGTTNLAAPPPPPRALTLSLSEPTPNPSREGAVFALSLPQAGQVSLLVYDLQGRHLRTLVDAVLPAGEQRVSWDGRDSDGRAAAPGVYFARLWTPQGARVRRVVRVH